MGKSYAFWHTYKVKHKHKHKHKHTYKVKHKHKHKHKHTYKLKHKHKHKHNTNTNTDRYEHSHKHVKSPQSVVISDIHHNHHNHHTLWWFIWGLHLIHLSAPQLPSLTNLKPQSSAHVCSSYSFESQPWTINENFHFFSFRFIRGQGVNFLHYFGFFSLPKQSLGYKVSKNIYHV